MRHINIDAENWRTIEDFYDSLLLSLGAPNGHGRDINALIDSIIGGDMNAVEPPFVIFIHNTKELDKNVFDHICDARKYLAKARAETRVDWGRDVEATIDIVP